MRIVSPAFTDVWAEHYYPAISLYKAATATANFGPDFKFPPPAGAKPYCELGAASASAPSTEEGPTALGSTDRAATDPDSSERAVTDPDSMEAEETANIKGELD